MVFTKKLRARVQSGEITSSLRIWKYPRVKVGGKYPLEGGFIVVTSLWEITWENLSDGLARQTGFENLTDLLRTAKHGHGQRIFYVSFGYQNSPMEDAN